MQAADSFLRTCHLNVSESFHLFFIPFAEIPGYVEDHNSVRALGEQAGRENPGALVMKKILVPTPFDEFWQ
jgi:hypothetical protein